MTVWNTDPNLHLYITVKQVYDDNKKTQINSAKQFTKVFI